MSVESYKRASLKDKIATQENVAKPEAKAEEKVEKQPKKRKEK